MERKEFIKILGLSAISMGMSSAVFATLKHGNSDEEICRLTWDKLCGTIGSVYKSEAFKYVHPKKGLPNVFIYGDSISIAYSQSVREELNNKATVIRLFKNGGSSHNFIENMEELQEKMFQPSLEKGWNFKWDLIHFNVGLHDLKYLKGKNLNKANGKQVSSIREYQENLNEICKYLKLNFPKAKLIFATTTPVPKNTKGRFEGDSVTFNTAALEVLKKYPDIIINDLYSFTKPNAKIWAQEPGNVHYNDLGFTQQGKEVARLITKELK